MGKITEIQVNVYTFIHRLYMHEHNIYIDQELYSTTCTNHRHGLHKNRSRKMKITSIEIDSIDLSPISSQSIYIHQQGGPWKETLLGCSCTGTSNVLLLFFISCS